MKIRRFYKCDVRGGFGYVARSASMDVGFHSGNSCTNNCQVSELHRFRDEKWLT